MYDSALDSAHLLSDSAASDFWQTRLCALPHGRLLERPAGITKSAHSMTLVHATEHLKSITDKKTLFTAPGCLLSCVYTVPGYESRDRIELHNYGLVVFRHKGRSAKLERIAITIKDNQDLSLRPFSYLALGEYYNELIHDMQSNNYAPINQAMSAINELISPSVETIFNKVRMQYNDKRAITSYGEASEFLTLMHKVGKKLPIISFGYFEAVSQCLMLLSQDKTTLEYAKKGQLNNGLYVRLLHEYAAKHMNRFDASLFNPSVEELLELIHKGVEESAYDVDDETFVVAIANQLIALIGGQIAVTQGALRGHSLYLFIYQQDVAFSKQLQAKTDQIITRYWRRRNIGLVYNAATIKGEVGITPCLKRSLYKVSSLRPADTEQEFTVNELLDVTIRGEAL